MGQREETIVRDYLKAWEGEKADLDKIMSMFAPDGYWHILFPHGPKYQGQAALRAEIERQLEFVSNISIRIVNITTADGVVMVEHVDSMMRKGVQVHHALMGVFEVNEDGLITANRDYFDPSDLAGQAGEDSSSHDWME